MREIPFFRFNRYTYPNSIVKRLADSRFDAIAFHNNYGVFFNRIDTFTKMGFKNFYDVRKMGLKEYGWGAKDDDMFVFIKDKLKEQKQPFMYYIITMSSHEPFKNVGQYYSNDHYNDIKEEMDRNYFNSLSYVDNALKELIPFIKINFPNSYIFIFGDHGFCFKAHLFKPAAISNMKVTPLLIVTPNNKNIIEKARVASMLDLGVSILNASGIDFEVMTNGTNLLDIPIKVDSIITSNIYGLRQRKKLFNEFYMLENGE